jgi:integrase
VQDKFKKLRAEMENGVDSSAKYTVGEAVRDWLSRGLIGRDAGTIEKNRILAETHVIPLLGAVKLREPTADHVDDWLADRTKVLATRSLKDTHAILRRAIQHAQRRNKVLRNVAELVDISEGRPGRPSKAMPLAQAQAVIEASKKTRLHAYFVLSLLTGVRTEEARALTCGVLGERPERAQLRRGGPESACFSSSWYRLLCGPIATPRRAAAGRLCFPSELDPIARHP